MRQNIRETVQNQLGLIKAAFEKYADIYALYVHGSIAMDCMGPDSDIDILGVVREENFPRYIMKKLAETALEVSLKPYPLEISLLAKSSLRPFSHPSSYIFHYSEGWRQRYESGFRDGTLFSEYDQETPVLTDRDLAAHIMITRTYGIPLSGPEPTACFEPVPPEAYRDALIYDFEGLTDCAEENPVYAVLNACRVLAYHNDRLVTSKKTGGLYGLESLPEKWHPMICEALYRYENGKSAAGDSTPTTNVKNLDAQSVRDFIAFATVSMSL